MGGVGFYLEGCHCLDAAFINQYVTGAMYFQKLDGPTGIKDIPCSLNKTFFVF